MLVFEDCLGPLGPRGLPRPQCQDTLPWSHGPTPLPDTSLARLPSVHVAYPLWDVPVAVTVPHTWAGVNIYWPLHVLPSPCRMTNVPHNMPLALVGIPLFGYSGY